MAFFGKIRGWLHRWSTFSNNRADLSYVLEHADPKQNLTEKLEWLEQFINWIRYSGSVSNENLKEAGILHSARIRFIFQQLERHPDWGLAVAKTLRSVLIESSGVALYSETGLAEEFGWGAEIFGRLTRKILPTPQQHADLAQVFNRIFNSAEDVEWVQKLPREVREQIIRLLFDGNTIEDGRVKKSFADDLTDALIILAARVESLGLSPEIRTRLNHKRVSDSPFVRLHVALLDREASDQIETLLAECLLNVQEVYAHLENLGVSISVVYRLDVLKRSLDRIKTIAALLGRIQSDDTLAQKFVATLIKENIRKNSIRELVRDQFRLLAQKIVERNGSSGEHYIARDRKEWFHSLLAASGGGFLTVFTALFKFFIIRLSFAPFFEGLSFWINYSGSFLLMQFFGFTLATKQPSATAPALAGKLKEIEREHQLDQFVDEVILIVRSQFAAAVGNIGIVIPSAILVGVIYTSLFQHTILTTSEAEHTIASLHPFKTLTILHATLTGFLLWLSSLAGGWLENLMVYHQIPVAIAESRNLITIFGKKNCETFAEKFIHNISGIGVNLMLGFSLAFTPIISKFFGFPLEAKHVTLSSGSLSFAIVSIPRAQLDLNAVAFAFLGILFIGLLNFGVSFCLALFVAQRARQVPVAWVFKLFRAVRKRFFKNPIAFFFAPIATSAKTDGAS